MESLSWWKIRDGGILSRESSMWLKWTAKKERDSHCLATLGVECWEEERGWREASCPCHERLRILNIQVIKCFPSFFIFDIMQNSSTISQNKISFPLFASLLLILQIWCYIKFRPWPLTVFILSSCSHFQLSLQW